MNEETQTSAKNTDDVEEQDTPSKEKTRESPDSKDNNVCEFC